MEIVLANVVGRVRRETHNGRDYIVAPLAMLVPGVLNGSQGPLYYPPEEIASNPADWNGMPLVVYHPVRDGVHVSARDPAVLEHQGIGHVYKANADGNGRLVAEGWFDVEATRRADLRLPDQVRILPRLERGQPIELSTGLYTQNDPAPDGATYNGIDAAGNRVSKSYTYVARNYKPDHLAILPDQKGACSLADGCGVMVNESSVSANDVSMGMAKAGPTKEPSVELGKNVTKVRRCPECGMPTPTGAAKCPSCGKDMPAANAAPARPDAVAAVNEVQRRSLWRWLGETIGVVNRVDESVVNAFCPTGKGGGSDNSCPPAVKAAQKGVDKAEVKLAKAKAALAVAKDGLLKAKGVLKQAKAETPRAKAAAAKAKDKPKADLSGHQREIDALRAEAIQGKVGDVKRAYGTVEGFTPDVPADKHYARVDALRDSLAKTLNKDQALELARQNGISRAKTKGEALKFLYEKVRGVRGIYARAYA